MMHELNNKLFGKSFVVNEETVTSPIVTLMKQVGLFEDGFDFINSITKYPSIYTYQPLEKGIVQDGINEGGYFKEGLYNITEKVDGTNARIVFWNGDYIIGSREDILYAKGDRIISKNDLITPSLIELAERLKNQVSTDKLNVLYLEVYGHDIQNKVSKNYTNEVGVRDYRLFDISIIDYQVVEELSELNNDQIAGWRQRDRERFLGRLDVEYLARIHNIKTVPVLEHPEVIPTSTEKVLPWLEHFRKTKVGINGVEGNSEGVIVRSADNELIRKIRFEDYEKWLKRQGKK